MRKVFLYLYPIEEYFSSFNLGQDFYDMMGRRNPFEMLNECIQKRYREKGYDVIFATYRDRDVLLEVKSSDKIVLSNLVFFDSHCYDESGKIDKTKEWRYTSEEYLHEQIGEVDEIIIGGFHFLSCVKRVAEYFYNLGINTLVDLELTDIFFGIYYKDDFVIDNYSLDRYKNRCLNQCHLDFEKEFFEEMFSENFESPVYGFFPKNIKNSSKDLKNKL